jgi:tetratricopeptide (TPR) repeat protein
VQPAPNDDAEWLLNQGVSALKAGDSARARELLGQAIRRNPRDERAWLWLSGAVNTDAERRQCLERVLLLNPHHAAARSGLAMLDAPAVTPPAVAPANPPAAAPSPLPPARISDSTSVVTPPPLVPLDSTPAPAAADPLASLRPASTPRRLSPPLVAAIALVCVVVALGAILAIRRFAGAPSTTQPTTAPAIALAATDSPTATRQPTPTRARPTQATTATPTSAPTPTAAPTSTPSAADKLVLQGLAKSHNKDYQRAIVLYNRALARDTQNTEAYFQRGQARDGLGDSKSAIKNYTQVLQIDPNHAAAYSARGDARLKLKDRAGALEDYQRAAEIYTSAGDTERAQAIAAKIKALQ